MRAFSYVVLVLSVMALAVPPRMTVRAQISRASRIAATSLDRPVQTLIRVRAGDTWRASNAGSHWRARSVGKREMDGIACPSTLTCFVIGIDGNFSGWRSIMYRTGDAGKSWQTHAIQPTSVPLSQMACPTVRVCYAVGATPREDGKPTRVSSVIVRTTDGARTWHIVYSTVMVNGRVSSCAAGSKGCVLVERVVCPAAGVCYALAYPAMRAYTVAPTWSVLLTTVDAGRTWRQRRINVFSETAALACPSTAACYVVGGVNASSGDGGRTWRKHPGGPRGYIEGIACPGMRICYTTGFLSLNGGIAIVGTVAVTDDGGRTWHEHRYAGAYMNALSCPTVSVCYAVGSNSGGSDTIILATRNGGRNWQRETVPSPVRFQYPRAVACPGTDTCFAVGNGTIFTRR